MQPIHKRAVLPSLVTTGNLFLGFYAILLITRGSYLTASWLIVIAAILDGLDGLVARLIRSNSSFGKEIDSLADVVSFGVAPSLLLYKVVFESIGAIGIFLAFMPLLAGILRLARFNISPSSTSKRRRFKGLAITAGGLLFAGFNLYLHETRGGMADQRLWFSLVPAVSLLMISPIPYRPLPVVSVHGSRYPWLSVVVLVGIGAAVLWNPALTIFPLMLIYLLTGPLEWVFTQLRKVRPHVTERDEDISDSAVPNRRYILRRNRRRNP